MSARDVIAPTSNGELVARRLDYCRQHGAWFLFRNDPPRRRDGPPARPQGRNVMGLFSRRAPAAPAHPCPHGAHRQRSCPRAGSGWEGC
jgi:hypothetical protein